jgi:hypothetical protein
LLNLKKVFLHGVRTQEGTTERNGSGLIDLKRFFSATKDELSETGLAGGIVNAPGEIRL